LIASVVGWPMCRVPRNNYGWEWVYTCVTVVLVSAVSCPKVMVPRSVDQIVFSAHSGVSQCSP